jgi:hypothetical protein
MNANRVNDRKNILNSFDNNLLFRSDNHVLRCGKFRISGLIAALSVVLPITGCSTELGPGMVGRPGVYDYSPTVIQNGDIRQIWWCGQAVNPNNRSQDTDTIQYLSMNLVTNETHGPVTVLAETPGAWDSVYTCNPKAIGGVFNNPLGDGETYHYALYYVATSNPDGWKNSIGVAFSNDGITWKKYPQPVILNTAPDLEYGVGQPSLYNRDGKSGIAMFYEDTVPVVHHVAATSTDGIHFTVQGTLTTAGLNPDNPAPFWGDMAYDPTTDSWYAIFVTPLRDPATTGGVLERGAYGSVLYKIPSASLLTGATPWQELDTIDTNRTGYESNFLAGFVRDPNGNVNVGPFPSSPSLDMYISVSNPMTPWDASPTEAGNAGDVTHWDLTIAHWISEPSLPLSRYLKGTTYIVTTGRVDPGFQLDKILGHVYTGPQHGASVPFYACKAGTTDYFTSLDPACEGGLILGKNGYGYPQPVDGLNLVAIYRCTTSSSHFVSTDPKCEGQKLDEFLGYILP